MDLKEKKGWQTFHVGSVPLPVYLVLSLVILVTAYLEQLPVNMLGGFAVILTMGWFLGTLGANIPYLKNFGGPAIMSLLIPSILVFFNLINDNVLQSADMLMKQANFLYFYIACLVCGSILGMNRKILVQGLMKMIIPMMIGMVLAMGVGTLVGVLLGMDWKHTLFFVVTPVLAGGIGEGILPLSLGYSQITGMGSEQLVGQLIPATIIGNFFAIGCSAFISRLGEKKPHLSGKGQLVKQKPGEEIDLEEEEDKSPIDVKLMGAGVLTACTLFITGGLLQHLTGFPGPVLMIVVAAALKYINVVPAETQRGSKQLYKFISGNFTFPLMAGLGLLYIPLKDVVGVLTWQYFLVVISTVLTVITTGFFVSKFMNMYPVEAAIISACQSGMGGTGDVAILSTTDRMNLMPFAQVATRLGGAITVISMTFIFRLIF
ncbi:2-hydroxycarboxylate transporter family protein [Vagococcus fluvialis]|jgi:CCS family citrate carrier protein|uniref:2-hydroxycarboxylate transporter family protein n=1 Tax=Vagococcus fluvialis TaxID=2738 RepID=A0A7X6DAH4_9ENTE|nr:2-hydroxycarboxylate transporter family protein [Vagococcus fluvialis]MBO0427867.1 2-hydroxycarboxylate transporter family protein [Vagococcus fluvialis]MBO0437488.1 2-hydroxycarboxylate transporter family protein [Vagococcus fluvialis]MBO0442359.1 2-hydroxycarboxylate transporter family protein [Vagococcus fluvialis]MBO0488254.1 2-hydroxycarboxylate transporter family protein [Vagococcus fluvialis]MCM2139308.1 2-hydroxycarboxylate transporter family protein [Vagococcus fluvialis]